MKIKSISKKPYKGKVYNFACTPDHTYVANGVVVHNCYKSNSYEGENMTFETFKKIFDILPKSITQIAFGADSTLKSNPDIWKMMDYCRKHNVIPNITCAQIDDETADNLAKYCGATALSRYHDKDACYDSVKRLTDRGMKQVNIHYMIAEETYDTALEVLDEIKTDPRLEKLNAIVFLSLKKKGRAVINDFHCLSQEKFDNLVKQARELGVSIGFDACSSKKALNTLSEYKDSIEPCEATLSSSYISVKGDYYPCSFQENVGDWKEGISVLDCRDSQDFIDRIWNNEKTEKFRQNLIKEVRNGCKGCPIYEI